MATPLFNEAFIIFRRDENGKPVEIFQCDTNVATYVSTSIMICRGMLKDSTVQDAFQALAIEIGPMPSGSWYEYQDLPEKNVATLFIKKILDSFPLIFVDYSMKNPDYMGITYRREWGFDGSNFESRKMCMVLNGEKTHSMCIAGRYAEEANDPNSDAAKRFRSFLFQFAITMLHELTHIYITFLSLGKIDTPLHIASKVIKNSSNTGESGIWLEEKLFHGRLTILRNTEEDDHQAGLNCLINKEGVHLVLQETIDDFVKYEFKFPILPLGPACPHGTKTLGSGLPPERLLFGNPMMQPETQKLLDEHEARHEAIPSHEARK